jgi:hypothetical protein
MRMKSIAVVNGYDGRAGSKGLDSRAQPIRIGAPNHPLMKEESRGERVGRVAS